MPAVFLEACPVCGAAAPRPLVAFPELAFGRCGGCGLVYKTEQAPDLAAGYDRGYFEEGRSRYLRRWAHRVRKSRRQLRGALVLAPSEPRALLDVGCSAGYVLEAARELGLSPVGLDLSSFAVSLCREKGLPAEVGDLGAMPFEDERFDLVTMKHTLEHTEDPQAALAEVRRVLRPGGLVVIVVPDVTYWKRYLLPRRGSYFRPDRAGWQHHVYYSERHLAEVCRRSGLEPVHAGKAIRRPATGVAALLEGARHAMHRLWRRLVAGLHLRREIQLVARRPAEPAPGT